MNGGMFKLRLGLDYTWLFIAGGDHWKQASEPGYQLSNKRAARGMLAMSSAISLTRSLSRNRAMSNRKTYIEPLGLDQASRCPSAGEKSIQQAQRICAWINCIHIAFQTPSLP